jgi:hypothetical protein
MDRKGRILMADPSIYDQLAKESFSDLTITQLNAGTSVTAVDQATIEYWKGPITLARILESSRTYAGGTLPIPETGHIQTEDVAASNFVAFQPSGTEVWQVLGIQATASSGTPTINIELTDGANVCLIHSGTTSTTASNFNPFEAPFTISNTLYLAATNTHVSDDANVAIAYSKVSL